MRSRIDEKVNRFYHEKEIAASRGSYFSNAINIFPIEIHLRFYSTCDILAKERSGILQNWSHQQSRQKGLYGTSTDTTQQIFERTESDMRCNHNDYVHIGGFWEFDESFSTHDRQRV
jgi:hypothetical protein